MRVPPGAGNRDMRLVTPTPQNNYQQVHNRTTVTSVCRASTETGEANGEAARSCEERC